MKSNNKAPQTPSQSCRQGVSAIDGEVLAVQVLIRHSEQDSTGNVDIAPRPGCGDLALVLLLGDVALLEVVRLAGGHLGGEDAGGEAVDADLVTVRLDLLGKHAVQVDGGGLGGVVGEVMLGDLDQARDGCDVEDGAGPAWAQLC